MSKVSLRIFLLALFLLFLFNAPLRGAEAKIGAKEGPSLTIYNQNRALIKEKHMFDLDKGINHFDWDNLPSTIDINSVSLSSVNGDKPIEVKEQSYHNDLINSSSILTRSIGKTVYLKRFLSDGRSEEQSGILLGASSSSEQVIKIGERYVLNPKGQIEVAEIPTGLVAQPNLSFAVKALEGGQKNLLLTYEASNINWQCDYNLLLNDAQDKCDLSGWITLNNQCGLGFKNANLKLIAGNVQMVRKMPRAFGLAAYGGVDKLSSASVQEQSFADYHLYVFPEAINLDNNETKRLALVESKSIPVIKKYVFDQQYYVQMPPKQKIPVQIKLEFQNDEKNKQPLPGGQIRVYQADADNEMQLIGEDRIRHTPVGEKVTIKLGDAFDVVGERTRVSSEQIATHRRKDTYKVTFNNHLDKDVIVTDIEHVPDLALFNPDTSFTKINSNTFECNIKVPAAGTAELNYTIESKI